MVSKLFPGSGLHGLVYVVLGGLDLLWVFAVWLLGFCAFIIDGLFRLVVFVRVVCCLVISCCLVGWCWVLLLTLCLWILIWLCLRYIWRLSVSLCWFGWLWDCGKFGFEVWF